MSDYGHSLKVVCALGLANTVLELAGAAVKGRSDYLR